jgi:hypothetical protein
MPDFTWTQHVELLRPRAAIQAAFEHLGYCFTTGQPASGRPRIIGETNDQRARIVLIGPPDVVFKATLMLTAAEPTGAALADIQNDLVDFLTVMTPKWEARTQWLRTHWDVLQRNQSVETHFGDFVIAWRTARAGRQIVLGVTWQPRHDASEARSMVS